MDAKLNENIWSTWHTYEAQILLLDRLNIGWIYPEALSPNSCT
jgi:hypothetical protein